jgi:uncharacterized membrane protein YkgB
MLQNLGRKRAGGIEYTVLADSIVIFIDKIKKVHTTRWFKAEPYILKSPQMSYMYTASFSFCRPGWSRAEPTILKDTYWAYAYSAHILNQRWFKAERVFAKNKTDFGTILYCQTFRLKVDDLKE